MSKSVTDRFGSPTIASKSKKSAALRGEFVGEQSPPSKPWLKAGARIEVVSRKPFDCHGREFYRVTAERGGKVVRFCLAKKSVKIGGAK